MTEGGAVAAELKDGVTLVATGAGAKAAVAGVTAAVAVVVVVMLEVVAAVPALAGLVLRAVVEDRSAAEGTKGLASTLRPDPKAVVLGVVKTAGCGTLVVSGAVVLARGAVASAGVWVMGVVVCESGVEPGGVWSTESRNEKVWETGLKLSPVIKAKLPLTSSDKPALLALLAAAPVLDMGLLPDMSSLSTHIGS